MNYVMSLQIGNPMLRLLSTSLVALLMSGMVHADLVKVSDAELTMNRELNEDVFRTVQYLTLMHYLPNKLDDDYSSRTLDAYLDLLDPNKVYFTQQDVDDFQGYRFQLDDYLKKNNAEPAFVIFKRYRQRMSERTELISKLLSKGFDFDKDESLQIDKDQYTWAKSNTEINDKWRKRIKNDFLSQLLSETPEKEIKENLTRRYQRQLDVTYSLKSDEVFEWFMNAYTKELEPHTQYMSDMTAENFRINMSLSLEGIGAALQTEEDYTVINRIIPGGPAERSNALHPEDKIVGVGQDGEEIINVIGWRLMDVVQMIRGNKGTKVTLQLLKHDDVPGSPPVNIELVRDVIHLEDQAAKLTEIKLGDNNKQSYSVISIPSFYSNSGSPQKNKEFSSTSHDVRKLIKQVNDSDSKGLVIDLRGNGGGYLNEAINLTGLFIPQGPVVQVVKSNRESTLHSDTDGKTFYTGPMVVLVDRFSASASEIFAAAMQDYGRAVILGERSFGKGTVQRVVPLRYGANVEHESQIKFTTAQFFRINGDSTQHKGVIPDIVLNTTVEDKEFGERAYENALPWSQTKSAHYQAKPYSEKLFSYLSTQHLHRAEESSALRYLRNNAQTVAENRQIKSLSLNLEQRQLLRKEQEEKSLNQLNKYRESLGLQLVTSETKKDNPLPDEDEHWNIVYHTEAAKILSDIITWENQTVAKHKN